MGFTILLAKIAIIAESAKYRYDLFRTLLLGFHIKTVTGRGNDVAGLGVVPGLGTALGIDAAVDVVELLENVMTSNLEDQAAGLEEGLADGSIQDKVVVVHCLVLITSTTVHGEIHVQAVTVLEL